MKKKSLHNAVYPNPEESSGKGTQAEELLQPYGSYFASPATKLSAIRNGLGAKALNHLIQLSGATQTEVARWLDITEPTFRKYVQSKTELNKGISEHLIELFALYSKGIDTFGSIDEFKSWIKHYNTGIDAVPSDLLDTLTGIKMVMNELIRIDYGATA